MTRRTRPRAVPGGIAASRSSWCWAPAPSASARASSSTTARSTASGRCKKLGYEAVIINNNPETVSTDFDTADRLYFEPLTPEDVQNVMELEKPWGVVVQFGGQTAIKLTKALDRDGRAASWAPPPTASTPPRTGSASTSCWSSCGIPRAKGTTVVTHRGGAEGCRRRWAIPVLLRPSYVLGGQNMDDRLLRRATSWSTCGIINCRAGRTTPCWSTST